MFDELHKSIRSTIYERVVSPFYGTLLVSWCLWNWKIIYLTFFVSAEQLRVDKLTYIRSHFHDPNFNYWYPIISAIILITVVPFISNGAYWFSIKFQKWKQDKKHEIERSQLLTIEQSIALRTELRNTEEEFEKNFSRIEKDKKNLVEALDISSKEITEIKSQIENNSAIIAKEKKTVEELQIELAKLKKGKDNTIRLSEIFSGKWNSVFFVPAQNGEKEWRGNEKEIEFTADNKYIVSSKHLFDIDMIDYNPQKKLIKFRKISLDGGQTERITSDLKIVSENEVTGVEDNLTTGNNITITYTRTRTTASY